LFNRDNTDKNNDEFCHSWFFYRDDRQNFKKNFIMEQKTNYTVLLADEAVQKDLDGIAILPTMILVSREGIFLKKYSGYIERNSLVGILKRPEYSLKFQCLLGVILLCKTMNVL